MPTLVMGIAIAAGGIGIGYQWGNSHRKNESPAPLRDSRRLASASALANEVSDNSRRLRPAREIATTKGLEPRRQAMKELAAKVSSLDLAAIHSKLLEFTSIEDQMMLIQELLELWQDDPQRTLEFAKGLHNSPYKGSVIAQGLAMTAVNDPAGAMAQLPGLLKGVERHNAMLAIIGEWAASAPDQAMAYALANQGPGRAAMLETIAAVWGGKDPGRALQAFEALPEPDKTNSLRAVVGTWSQSDGQAALDWARTHAEKTGDQSLFVVGLSNAAQADPALAARSLAGVNNASVQAEVAPLIARTWTSRDPEAGWQFATSVSDPEARTQSVSQAVEVWMDFDPTSASEAIRNLPSPSEVRRAAVEAFSLGMASRFNGELPPGSVTTDPAFARELESALQRGK